MSQGIVLFISSSSHWLCLAGLTGPMLQDMEVYLDIRVEIMHSTLNLHKILTLNTIRNQLPERAC